MGPGCVKSGLSLPTQRRSIHGAEKPAGEPPELCSREWRRASTQQYTQQLIKRGWSGLSGLGFMGHQWAIVGAVTQKQAGSLISAGEWLQYPSLLAWQFMCYTRFVSIPPASSTSPSILGSTQTNEKKATSVISPSDGRQFGLLQRDQP